jgi:maltose alpha-D-glucosyltransferase/alpha-amylase
VNAPYKGPVDPLWYKDAIVYELHVRAFSDSNGDGIGDFPGLTEKLDYLEDLGVNTLWLLPFYPSPLKDDGYDISDYVGVHPSYGTMADFKTFLREAHRRGLRVITELVLNHTSDQHAWFQRARRAPPGSRWRKWYVWNQTPELYREARIIFSDFERSNWSWDAVAQAYYWHRFYAHQPDLNFDHPDVHRAILEAADFWMDLGVDGFRLDAIPYLYERDGTSCENLPETHDFLRKLRKHIDDRHPHRMLLAEANQWPEDAVAYFGTGNECHMAFHFPIMTRLFLAVHMEDRYPMVDILEQTPSLPEASQWALFLRNHDELTLEMVTDQERDYMVRAYAQETQARVNLGIRRRLAPLLQNNRKKIELLNALLFSLPGTPVIYYGDEIGMGDNIFLGDRSGLRTPMQWSGDRNAGFSRAHAQRLYLPVNVEPEYHYEAVNVEAQQANPQSLLWWMKRLLALSRRFKAFGRGTFELLAPENRRVLAFVRRYQDEVILVVANLSRFAQHADLDLRSLKGRIPVELFGRSAFPRIGDSPYLLTLGPHAFYWFALELPRDEGHAPLTEDSLRTLDVGTPWTQLFEGKPRHALEGAILSYLRGCSWFGGRTQPVRSLRIQEAFKLDLGGTESVMAFIQVEYELGEPETYSLPLVFASGEEAQALRNGAAHEIVAALRIHGGPSASDGVLYNALANESFVRALLQLLAKRGQIRTPRGKISAIPFAGSEQVRKALDSPLTPTPEKGDPSHSTFNLGNQWILRWYRSIQDGVHPELEVARFMSGRDPAPPVMPLAGHWEYLRQGREPITLAILHEFVPLHQDAWTSALDELGRYFETVRSLPGAPAAVAALMGKANSIPGCTPSPELREILGPYLESARKMGACTARLHQALAFDTKSESFSPEPFTPHHQRACHQALRKKTTTVLPLLERSMKAQTHPWVPIAERVLALKSRLLQFSHELMKKRIRSVRIRCHGDLDLRHLRSTGSDFVVVGLPGPSHSPFIERQIKRSPLWDVAGMMHSFRSATHAALNEQEARGEAALDRLQALEHAAAAWYGCIVHTYLEAYLGGLSDPRLGLGTVDDRDLLLRAYLVEKTMDDLHTALLSRPERVPRLLQTLLELMNETTDPKPFPEGFPPAKA